MSVSEILEAVQFVVDREGQQRAVLLDLHTWDSLRLLLEELAEDERLGQLLLEVEADEKLEGDAAWRAYQAYLAESK